MSSVSLRFRYLDHITDAVIEAYGRTLAEAFENSAYGLVNTMFDLNQVSPNQEIKIEAKGYDLESLLYDWLEKVLLTLLVENIIISVFKIKIYQQSDDNNNKDNSYFLSCTAMGECLNLKKHHYKVEIKAVTYHEMEVIQETNKVTTRFLLDL
jgi:SHS2 domain-containing protein